MKNSHHQLMTIFIALSALGLTGCKDAFSPLDCVAICDSYKECKDDTLDVAACEDSCYAGVEGNELMEDDAADCTTCITDKTCSAIDESCDTCPAIYATFLTAPMGMGGAE